MTTRQVKMDYSVENLSSSILERLNEFRKQSFITDVEFCVQGQYFACHQAVLACCSPMITSVLTSENRWDKISECFAGMDANSVKDLLDFMYTGKVTIAMHNVEHLLKVSTVLKFEQLTIGCVQFKEKYYSAEKFPEKIVCAVPISCRRNELTDEETMHQDVSKAVNVPEDTKKGLKCGSNIDASKLLKCTHDEDRNVNADSDDADVFDSGSDRNDDPHEEDTTNEECALSNAHTEADISEDKFKIENEVQNEAAVPELFTGSNDMVVCGNKDSSNMADVEKPVNPASVNPPHHFETDSSTGAADVNMPGSPIQNDQSLSRETHTDISNNINHADAVTHETKIQTGREASFLCEFCGETFPWNHLFQQHRNQEHSNESQGRTCSDGNCNEKHKYLCTKCNCEFGSKGLLQDHLLVHCQGLQTKEHGTTSASESQEISTEQSANTQRENVLPEDDIYKKDFKPQTHQCQICKKSYTTNWLFTQHRYKIHRERVWSCKECDVIFHRYKSLKEHRKTHDQDLKYQCEKCKKWFGRKETHDSHVQNHKYEKSIECKKCDKVFKVKNNYIQHMNMHERKTPFKCHVCNVKFAFYDDLLKHEEISHKTEKIYKCPECDESFDGTLSLRQHRSKMHAVLEQCKLCNEVFPTKDELYQHRQKVHKLRNHHCVDCKVTFETKYQLYRHKNENHLGLPLTCEECLSVFENEELLKQHHSIHDKEAIYSCDECGKMFGRKEIFDKHVRCHRYRKPHPCEECGKVFYRKSNLVVHIRRHSGIEPYSCPVCNKRFARKTHAEKHQKIHRSSDTSLKPWSCSECKKTFKQEIYLTIHQKNVHTNKKAHLCDKCGKSFKYRQSLTEHKRVHTGERPYKCELCGKSFKSSPTLNSHRWYIHSSEKPHLCQVCGKGFKSKGKVKRHLLVHYK